jgi:ATP-dependent Lhr-like helicase
MDPGGRVEFLDGPIGPETALASLTEPVRQWFRQHFGQPTPAQCLAWPAVASGQHLLLSAPTGGGKTLAVFLPLLGPLLDAPETASVKCLAIAPMKALCNDTFRNFEAHLESLRTFLAPDAPLPRIGLRTGDTSARERRQLFRHPPAVLLTTPESLALLLTRPDTEGFFADLRWVIVDEVHALAPNKRGTDLSLSLERLSQLRGGRLQRLGLSATCAPLEEATRFLVGAQRNCRVAAVPDAAAWHLTIEPLPPTLAGQESQEEPYFPPRPSSFLGALLDRLSPELTANRNTLVFTNSRALAERVAWALRQRYPAWEGQIGVHHSALAAPRRREVEERLKRGELRAVVTSTSLELGIDIGHVDAVVLVHPPGEVVRLLQRLGRAGHQPGQPRRGLVLIATPAELLEAAATAASGRSAQYEPLRTLTAPLDVLCQQLLGMAAVRHWTRDEAYLLVRQAYPYRDLSHHDFDDCLAYLSGRKRNGAAWLPPRLRWQGEAFSLLDERTARLVRRNLGTILSADQRLVRLRDRSSRPRVIGQVEEAYAEHLLPGDRFLLDGRCLEYRTSKGFDLHVEEVAGRPAVPRWNSENAILSAELAQRLFLLRGRAAEALRDSPEALARLLRDEYGLGASAANLLAAFFQRQEGNSEIPDGNSCLIEAVRANQETTFYFHTPLNRKANEALVRVVVARLSRSQARPVRSLTADLGFAITLRDTPSPEEWRALLSADRFEADLNEALAQSDALRDRFQRVALTGLMLLRTPLQGRRRVGGKDWGGRRLFDQVRAAEPEFVLLRQAEREVREECCDGPAALRFVRELPRRALRCRWLSGISPFVENWTPLATGPVESSEDPTSALERFHAFLTGGSD